MFGVLLLYFACGAKAASWGPLAPEGRFPLGQNWNQTFFEFGAFTDKGTKKTKKEEKNTVRSKESLLCQSFYHKTQSVRTFLKVQY